jgi:hypothetical protein
MTYFVIGMAATTDKDTVIRTSHAYNTIYTAFNVNG